MSFIKYIADENHYKEVLSLVGKAKQTVWIGTADIKDLYVDDKPFLALITSLLKKGVEVRLSVVLFFRLTSRMRRVNWKYCSSIRRLIARASVRRHGRL